MILTIKGADFSGSGLGTNTSVNISYKGNVTGTPGYIEKNTQLTSTITIKTGYTYNSITSVTVGGSTITGYTATNNGNGTVTLTIPANLITGKVVINVSTTATGGGETGGGSEGDSEQPGTGETQYYTLTHGNDYNASFVDSKTRVSIQPYTITVPTGVTITPKDGYLWAWMNNVNPDDMPSGSGGTWCGDTYTGTGKPIGITFKKSDDSEFDFSIDSIYASDYFDVSDSSIWIVDNSTPSEPSEPSEPTGENTDLSTLTLQHGNPFGTVEQQSDTTRANSITNAYLTEGTTITLKDNVTYKWALKKVTTETGKTVDSTFNSGNYVPDSVWTTKKSYTITKSGYYRIILLKSDNSAFDWSTESNIVSNYFELS